MSLWYISGRFELLPSYCGSDPTEAKLAKQAYIIPQNTTGIPIAQRDHKTLNEKWF